MYELKTSLIVWLGLTGTIASYLVTFGVRRLAISLGIYDYPAERKIHREAVPLLGGIALLSVGLLLMLLFARMYLSTFLFRAQVTGLVIGSALIAGFGVWDDVRGSGAVPKLLLQSIVAVIMYLVGIRIEQITLPGVGSVYLGAMGVIMTIIWFCLIINAINLIDGLDGLAAGLSLIAAGTILAISYSWSEPLAVLVAVIIISSCLGFLPHNFYPAKIFMGDTGSMLLGYWLATLSLLTSTKTPALLALFIPIIALGLPVFDAIFAFFRRVWQGAHPFRADMKHIHHRLLSLGYSHRHTVILLYIASAYLGVTAYILSLAETYVTIVTLLLLGLGVILVLEILEGKTGK